ncbi:hypothetical protein [Streptomyces sp. NPDC003719]
MTRVADRVLPRRQEWGAERVHGRPGGGGPPGGLTEHLSARGGK